MGRKRSDEFPLYFGSTQGSETPALCALARDRKLCELGEGDQAAVDVASLQASRFALRSTTGNAARARKDSRRGDRENVQRSRIPQGIPEDRRGRGRSDHAGSDDESREGDAARSRGDRHAEEAFGRQRAAETLMSDEL